MVESALDLLIQDRNKKKFGVTDRPRAAKSGGRAASGRKLPAADRREIAGRDDRRCAFVGEDGRRCESMDFVEFDHVTPYADGGESIAANSRLLCKPHNDFEARRILSDERVAAGRAWSAERRQLRAGKADSVETDAAETGANRSTAFADAACALRHAGFSTRESADAVARVAREDPDATTVEEILRRALRGLMAARRIATVS